MGLSLALLAPISAWAQDAASSSSARAETGSGVSAVPPREPTDAERLRALVDSFAQRADVQRSDMESGEQKLQALLDGIAEDRVKQIGVRERCRQDIRRANRDTKPDVVLRCYRGELAQESAQLRRTHALLQTLPGISELTRGETLAAFDRLFSAIQTLIEGIDAGVYDDATLLANAKKRLHAQYRLPQRSALLKARADRGQAWIALLARRMQAIADESGVPEGPEWREAILCLEARRDLLRMVPAQIGYVEMKSIFSQYQSSVTECAKSIVRATSVSSSTASTASAGRK